MDAMPPMLPFIISSVRQSIRYSSVLRSGVTEMCTAAKPLWCRGAWPLECVSKFFRVADVGCIMDLGPTVDACIARVFKNFVDFGVASIGCQLTGVQITMLLGIITAPFSHHLSPLATIMPVCSALA